MSEKKYMYRVASSASQDPIERLEVVKETPCTVRFKDHKGIERCESKSCDWQIWLNDLPSAIKLCQDRIDILRRHADSKQEALNIAVTGINRTLDSQAAVCDKHNRSGLLLI